MTHAALKDLLPCPFCGGADVHLHNTHTPKFWVECEECGAQVHGEYFPFRGNKDRALFSYEHDSEPGIPFQTGDISKMPAAYQKAAVSAAAAWNRRAALSAVEGEDEFEDWSGTFEGALENLEQADTAPPPQQASTETVAALEYTRGRIDGWEAATQPQQAGGDAFREDGLTGKEAWWAGARAGLRVDAAMPRSDVAALLSTPPQPEAGGGELSWQDRAAFIAKSLLDTIDWPCAGEQSATGKGMAHLRFVAETIAARGLGSDTKACRWLGYLQAGLIYSAATTLDTEKERNLKSASTTPASGGEHG